MAASPRESGSEIFFYFIFVAEKTDFLKKKTTKNFLNKLEVCNSKFLKAY